ncbi:DUF2264 domain-containing protein [Micromonospora sp. DR5-3]|uniref:DUF2264 domain-containing protein n=1 Tax=unclassified Micromonospora TaxID=2617518 RepID=UPI0011D32A33|nr:MULTISPECIES: DUF2264 domain-containing protein [unclassified Micromonospora]MCW3815974.1 DUF2264 domain-containing protein [Micromonospora sp. DR5-3]TYC20835.1 DUF2264 domain-containing protein [Micromonospora sp. MP36]
MAAVLPPLDPARSAHTGWTRAHWEAFADHLLQGARAHSSPSHARVRFPSDARELDATDELEGFARAFLLAALRIAGARGIDDGLCEWYADALAAGSDPGHPEAWPAIGHHGQPLVEATAIAVALHWTRPWLWDRLPEPVRQRVVSWLSGSIGAWSADNNHVMFGATVQAFLASVGADHDMLEIDGALARIEDWYAGDGWYTDGRGRRFDHYNAWTFHLYPFFITDMLGEARRPHVTQTYRTRLRMFLNDYQHLFDGTGSPLLQGRSLIYRWGVVAPFWMGALQDATPLSPGRTRRLASGVLRHFVDHGVGADGTLGLGWHHDTDSLLQPYNAPGSPHWASKGFLGLLLPADHPVWTAAEEPLELEERDVLRPLPGPGWLVHGTRDDGIVRVLNHGSDGHPRKDDPLYRRLAFSTRTAPVDTPVRDNRIDVALAGTGASRHRGLRAGTARPDSASSCYHLDGQGRDVLVDVATTVFGPAELRLVRVRGAVALPLRISGYAVSAHSPLSVTADHGWVRASRDDGLSTLLALVGGGTGDGGVQIEATLDAQDAAFGPHVGVPWLAFTPSADFEVRVACLVALTGQPWDPAGLLASLSVRWMPNGARVNRGAEVRHVPWVGEARWAADAINQGVFRVSG